jgi:hypothetical protein
MLMLTSAFPYSRLLESKYSNLCQLCDLPKQCGTTDKYWGPEGSLLCLSDEVGDVAWARLADALFHFGVSNDGMWSALVMQKDFPVEGSREILNTLRAKMSYI